MRVLVVEDQKHLAEAIGELLTEQKYGVDLVYDGEDGLAYAQSGQYDVVVLDVMLPGRDGFEVVRQMRAEKNATPVLLLTARDQIGDKVRGLDSGADDYMTKPFSSEELLARVRALARRQGDVVLDEMAFGDLTLSVDTGDLHCGEKRIHLGYKECQVLRLLLAGARGVTPKEELITRVWGYDSEAEDNNVEAYISFLRKKLTYLDSRVRIVTVRKVGYKLEDNGA